ncbi:LysR family transcriptional regulator [Paraburkholderia sp. MPAMCS5]|uniref:LysR family transcriptional regulator n=1 Tax=Paraburkholderia sp. MPAMCS5 TaxID=3112563 RepID=UPI002E17558F|nr:LysR family transcriptional regulator [Paraburkholderia sp. MPAMCS5]
MNKVHFPSMDMNLLRVFHSVYIEKNVSNAAEQLGLTQSAVSHGLRKLRELFDDELFVRSGTGMVATIRAQQLFEPVHRIMETLSDQVLAISTFDARAAQREFSLAMGDMAEVVFLPPLIRHFRAHAPNCTLRVQRMHNNEAMLNALEHGEAELALGNLPQAHGHFYSQTMFQHGYVVLASTQHPRIRSHLTWKDYAREQHIVVKSGLDFNLQEKALVPRGIKRKVFLTVSGFLSVPWLIQDTEFLATVPTRLSEGITQAAKVRQLDMPEPIDSYGLQSVWHPRWHKDPGHRWLRETLFNLMGRYPDVP